MSRSKEMDLTVGNPFRSLLKFAIPVILGNLFQLFYTLADSVIVGKTLGADSLAAVGSTSIIIYFVFCFINGFTGGFGICLGQRCGAKDEKGMRKSVAVSTILSIAFTVVLTLLCCLFAHEILYLMQIPADISDEAYDYMFVVLLGTGATVFYNMISNMLRALGDSKTPLYFLVFSSILNIFLDLFFILVFHMGVAGAAWATILSQFLSALLSLLVGLKNFQVLHLRREDFRDLNASIRLHLKTGFPMGFQMSVMCIGQLAMQAVVNSLGTAAVAGYTAASKADQLSVLVNNAMMTAISNYVAQNFGAGKTERIRMGVRACLIQTEAFNILMCAGILLLRHPIVRMFLSDPTSEIYHYSDVYLTIVAPFYLLLGLLAVYRTSIQSMQNGRAPFLACMIELVMRLAATVWLSSFIGYTAVCIASPLAWFGACALLIPCYYKMMGFRQHPAQTV
ncbi:MAG: MATE family efflux transporter [Lachnospiraceae bacterium]|nr:MATE family efflux transporter [Lachnospiraceae bacterium]